MIDSTTEENVAAVAAEPLPEKPKGFVAKLKVIIRAMRVYQWVKNLLLFVPLVASHGFRETSAILQVVSGFFVFGVGASAVYLLNDLLDIESDKRHPKKRFRPLASGQMSTGFAKVLAVCLVTGGLTLAITTLSWSFVAWVSSYLVLTTLYSIDFKRRVLVDVIALAGLYTLRILAGASAADVVVSHWLLVFSMFFFMSLAFVKRYTELEPQPQDGEEEEKLAGRGYYPSDLDMIRSVGPINGYLAVLVVALYVSSEEVRALYKNPQILWGVCPLLVYWITRLWFLAHRGQLEHDPVLFAVRDRRSLLVAGMIGAIVLAAAKLSL